ncbi:hypothetical protein MCGE09_00091 [Thaumarchaeota archaeon SCGC AB-539-E09]|nr:hypothetical protein MCGE09_00091 [Thaumarchaeota archaeon SCGC AB-539-E09]
MTDKKQWLVIFVFVIATVYGGVSVMAILQSSQRIGSSGLIVEPPPPSPPSPPSNPPPEPNVEINVFSNSQCTQLASNIKWGSIVSGKTVNKVVYVKNVGSATVSLVMVIENWDPLEASEYMKMSWNYSGSSVRPGEILEVVLTLSVDSTIKGIDTFYFDVIILGSAS